MKKYTFLAIVLLFSYGCSSEEENQTTQDTTTVEDTTTSSVTFAQASSVLMANCNGCHTNESKGAWNASDYASLLEDSYFCAGKSKAGCTVDRIEDGTMSTDKGKTVSAEDLQVLKDWVAAGAPE